MQSQISLKYRVKQSPIILLFFVLMLLSFASLLIGAKTLFLSELLTFSSDTWLILMTIRLPRLIALIFAGVGLSLSGVILQQITRNKFVEPATTGGLDAAKLGILISVINFPMLGSFGKMFVAMMICFIASLIFIGFLRTINFNNSILVPVVGLMYGTVLSAVSEFYAYRNNMLQNMKGWLLGDFSKIAQGNYEVIYFVIPIVLLTYFFASRFTLIGMGESISTSLGVNYKAIVVMGVILVSLTVSSVMITIGSIPFLGLIIPNLVAYFFGDQFKKTLPYIALIGSIFIIFCDLIGRLIIFPYEVPIGLTVSLIGGLGFILLVIKKSK